MIADIRISSILSPKKLLYVLLVSWKILDRFFTL